MKYICSLITVESIPAARTFYEKILKQKVKFDFGENIAFESGFAIHLKDHFSQLIGSRPVAREANNFELYFETDDMDAFVRELSENDVELVHEAREQPWRQKVVRFYDPDRNIVEVGETLEFLCVRLSREGKSIPEIMQITGLPEEYVDTAISLGSKSHG